MNKQKLKDKTKKAVNFVKEHKKQIIIGTIVAGGTVACVIMRRKANMKRLKEIGEAAVQLGEYKANWKVGELTDISMGPADWALTQDRQVVVNGLKPMDIGKLGEELFKLDGVTSNSTVSTVMYVWEPKEK